jgi:hypothetical protein
MAGPVLPAKSKLQYFFDRAHYVVGPEQKVDICISLQETFNPRTSSSLLAPGSDGLIQGGIVVEISSPMPTCPAAVRSTAAIAGNAEFDFAAISLLPVPHSANGAGILELSTRPVFGEVVSRNESSETVLLTLGTFTFTAGRVPGEVTFLNAVVPDGLALTPGEINVTSSGVGLDNLIQEGSAMITISPKSTASLSPDKLAGLASAIGNRSRTTERWHR